MRRGDWTTDIIDWKSFFRSDETFTLLRAELRYEGTVYGTYRRMSLEEDNIADAEDALWEEMAHKLASLAGIEESEELK